MKILVTGASGIIGSYLLRDLKAHGHELGCYSRSQPLEDHAHWFQGDIADADDLMAACIGHEAIVHLAAVTGPRRATPGILTQINVVGTVNVLEAARAVGIKKVVFASSGAASGFSFQIHPIVPEYLPIDEDHPSVPQDEYGLSKLLGELICRRYTDAYGIQTICLRINHNWCLDREGAEVAVRTKGMSVEKLWEGRYRKVIRQPEGEWLQPGPPRPSNLLWAVTDVRDAVQAFRLALEHTGIGHDVFAINGADTCSSIESAKLIEWHFPDVEIREYLSGYKSLVSHFKATRILGYHPKYSWRSSDFGDWLANH